jgi:hypothetical protein
MSDQSLLLEHKHTHERIRVDPADAGQVSRSRDFLVQHVRNAELWISNATGTRHAADFATDLKEDGRGAYVDCEATFRDTGEPFVPTAPEAERLRVIHFTNPTGA